MLFSMRSRKQEAKAEKFRQTDLIAQNSDDVSAPLSDKKLVPGMINDENLSMHLREGTEKSAEAMGWCRSLGIRVIIGAVLGLFLGFTFQLSIDFFSWHSPIDSLHRTTFEYVYCAPEDPMQENFESMIERKYGSSESLMKKGRMLYIQGIYFFGQRREM
jgi:hypothetical protein